MHLAMQLQSAAQQKMKSSQGVFVTCRFTFLRCQFSSRQSSQSQSSSNFQLQKRMLLLMSKGPSDTIATNIFCIWLGPDFACSVDPLRNGLPGTSRIRNTCSSRKPMISRDGISRRSLRRNLENQAIVFTSKRRQFMQGVSLIQR